MVIEVLAFTIITVTLNSFQGQAELELQTWR